MLQYGGSPRYLLRDNKSIPPLQLIVETYVTCLIAKTFVLAFQPSLPTHP